MLISIPDSPLTANLCLQAVNRGRLGICGRADAVHLP